MDMKLNKYIYTRLMEWDFSDKLTEEYIEDWITDWYMDTFQEIGCGGEIPKPRGPPMWLAGPRWNDRRKRIIDKAEEEERLKKAEEKSYEKDEV